MREHLDPRREAFRFVIFGVFLLCFLVAKYKMRAKDSPLEGWTATKGSRTGWRKEKSVSSNKNAVGRTDPVVAR